MGCDIHVHIEIRYEGKWEHYATPRVSRYYSLFGVMAGVRGDESPIVEPKGIPNDLSIVTKLDWQRYGSDAHTPSWFNEEEIDKLSDWLKTQTIGKGDYLHQPDLEWDILGTYLFGNSLTAFKHYDDVDYVPKGIDAVRLVFWFDN